MPKRLTITAAATNGESIEVILNGHLLDVLSNGELVAHWVVDPETVEIKEGDNA